MNIDLLKTPQNLDWFKNKLYLNATVLSVGKRTIFRVCGKL